MDLVARVSLLAPALRIFHKFTINQQLNAIRNVAEHNASVGDAVGLSLITIKFGITRDRLRLSSRTGGKCDTGDNDRVPDRELPFLEQLDRATRKQIRRRRCLLEAVYGWGECWVDRIMKTTGWIHTKNTHFSISHKVKADT